MKTTDLSTLKIHKLSQSQYERELSAGRIDEYALYLTPDEEPNLSNYATKDEIPIMYQDVIMKMVKSIPTENT